VNKSDKKGLVEELNPMERNHLRYLLMKDSQIQEMYSRHNSCKVFMSLFLFSFGLLQHNIEQIKEMEDQIEEFRLTNQQAIYCFFLGVVNHWITFIAHKEQGDPTIRFYFLDSQNYDILWRSD